MLYLGFLLASVGVGIMVFEYTQTLRAADREYCGTLSLLVHLRGAISTNKTPSESILRFLGGGEELRWAKGLDSEERINSFLRSREISRAAVLLSSEDSEALSDFFFKLGRGELCEERERLDRIINRIEESGASRRALSEGKIRSAWVIFVTAALGVLLLLI